MVDVLDMPVNMIEINVQLLLKDVHVISYTVKKKLIFSTRSKNVIFCFFIGKLMLLSAVCDVFEISK